MQAAEALAGFEDRMPLYTYFFPSKCKVEWGAGAMLRVLFKHGLGHEALYDKLYRACKRVLVYTFLHSQLPDGSWAAMFYPLSNVVPEINMDYRVLKGLRLNPADDFPGNATSSWLPAVEITGEFLGEIAAFVEGAEALLRHYRGLAGVRVSPSQAVYQPCPAEKAG